ncbi:MAG: DUF3108 domain-containing protein [Nitrospirae bacterium]|nr:DUF3108 domain-containing protein [Nitrospirota bacterium]
MRSTCTTPIIVLIFLVLLPGLSFAITIPEELQYELTWNNVKMGDASLAVKEASDRSLSITATGNTAEWFSKLFEIKANVSAKATRERDDKYMGNMKIEPSNYRFIINGVHFTTDESIFFNIKKKTASDTNHLTGARNNFKIGYPAFDVLTCFYYLRTVPVIVGKSIRVDIVDGNQLIHVDFHVLRKETVKTPVGSFNTVVVEPKFNPSGSGLLYLGKTTLWITDDQKKIPVAFQKEVPIPKESRLPGVLKKNLSSTTVKAVLTSIR